MAKLDENGHEILDDTPVAIPARLSRAETLTEQVRRLIREEASRAAQAAGFETFEEADDFEIEDDYDPRSPHELTLEQELEGYGDTADGSGENPAAGTQGSGGRDSSAEKGNLGRGPEAPGPSEKPAQTAGGAGGSGD